MPLDLAQVMALSLACAPQVAPSTLAAVAKVESGLNPLAIGLNGPGARPAPPGSSADAVRTAEALIAAGRNVDLGLAQINVRNLVWLGLSVRDAFDPCRNLAASARVLADGYRRASPAAGQEQQGLRTALSFYNTGHPQRGLENGYVARVVTAAARMQGGAEVLPGHQSGDAPPPPAWDVFARAARRTPAFVLTPSLGAQP